MNPLNADSLDDDDRSHVRSIRRSEMVIMTFGSAVITSLATVTVNLLLNLPVINSKLKTIEENQVVMATTLVNAKGKAEEASTRLGELEKWVVRINSRVESLQSRAKAEAEASALAFNQEDEALQDDQDSFLVSGSIRWPPRKGDLVRVIPVPLPHSPIENE